jgi:cobalt-zinc-cadmium efflux system membrane fusion protein
VVYVQTAAGVFRRREVAIGEHIGERVQVISGLAPGDLVVVKGALLLDSAADQLL